MQFSVIRGDIAAQEADALVNAAGTSLRMGSGVAGALRRAASPGLNDAAMAAGPIELGEVAVTEPFGLPTRHVIHAAAMPHFGDGLATEDSIRSATRNTLATADGLGCESLVIPALGCGAAGFPLETGAKFIAEEIVAFEPSSLRDVRFIAYAENEFETVREVASHIEGGS